jgi:hypothetical protein
VKFKSRKVLSGGMGVAVGVEVDIAEVLLDCTVLI